MARRARAIAATALLIVAAIVADVPSASAAPDAVRPPSIARRGACSSVSTWRLRVVSLPTAELRVRFAIVGGAAGETWHVYLDRDGVGFFAGSRTSELGGRVRVRRRVADGPSREVIRATAHDVETGEVCRGRVRARTAA